MKCLDQGNFFLLMVIYSFFFKSNKKFQICLGNFVEIVANFIYIYNDGYEIRVIFLLMKNPF